MISDDLANMADRMAAHALHGTTPPPAECGIVAAELLKLSLIVRSMESLPLDCTLMSLLDAMPEWQFARTARKAK